MRIVRFIITCLLLAVTVRVAAQPSACAPLALPLAEGFDSYGTAAMPPCWCSTGNYDMGAMPHLDASRHFNGSRSLYLYSGSLASHYSMAISPELALDSIEEVYAKFRFYAASTATQIVVGMCDDTNRYTRHFVPLDTLRAARPNQWVEMVVALPTDGNAGRRLAFRLQRSLQVENSECYIDDLRIGSCGTTVPEVSHLTSTSMTVSWVHYGSGSIALEYNGQRMDGVTSPLTLTGLLPSTPYTVSVGCNDSVMQQVTVVTLDATTLTPAHYEPFASNALPAGWQAPLECRPTVSGGVLTMQPAEGDSCLAVMPPLNGDAAEQTLVLRLKGSAGTLLVAGVMDYALEADGFVPVDTLECPADWQRTMIRYAPYGGTGKLLALMAIGTGTVQVDDLRVARCLLDSVHLYDLSDSAVTVVWDTLTPLTAAVAIEYGPRGFVSDSGTVVEATTNPFRLTGLIPSTEYDLLVTPACGDEPCAYDRFGIITFSSEVTAPYCMPFENIGSSLPQGWVCSRGSAAGSATAYQGSRSLRLAANSVVALPRIAEANGDTLVLEFYGYGSGRLEVGLMANPFTPFVPTDTLTGTGAWRRYLVTVTLPAGQLLALRNASAWNIDALAVHRSAVATASVSTLRQTSAHIAWTLTHGDSVALEYSAVASATADFAEGSGTLLHTRDSVTLAGLTPGTHYAVHLRPLEDDGSCHWQTLHLQTAAATMALPYCENFDALNSFPDSWRRLSDYGEYPLVTNERNHSPSKSMRFSATATAHTAALLPDFDSQSEHLTLAFWTNVTQYAAGALLLIGTLDDITDLTSFHATDTVRFTQTEVWQHHLIDLDSTHRQLALMLVGGSSRETRLFIDDLCLEHCTATNVRISNLDSNSVTFVWQGAGVAGIEARLSSDLGVLVDTFYSSPASLPGLLTNSPYSLRLKSLCECGSYGSIRAPGQGTSGNADGDGTLTFSFSSHPSTTTLPYCANFESILSGNFPGSWRRLGGRSLVSDRNYHNGGHSLLIDNGTTVVLPPLQSLAQLTATCYLFASNDAALAEGALLLGVMRSPDSAASFVTVDTLRLTHAGEWQRLWSDLSAYDSIGHSVALRLQGADSCTVYLDDLTLATCGFGYIGLRGDTLEWDTLYAPTMVAIEYGPQGFSPGSGQTDTATTSPYVLNHLAAGASYDVYLNALCGSSWGCTPLRVSASNATVIPYCEDFESAPPMSLPTGWSMGRTYDGTPAIGLGSLQMKGHSSSTHRSLAVLPPMDGSGQMQLSFSMKSTVGGNARLALGHISDHADPNTFVPIDTLTNDADTLWQRHRATVTLPASRRLALLCFSIGQEAEVWIDSLAVTRAISPTVTVRSARSLVLENDGDSYLEYGPAGFEQDSGTLLHLDSLHYELGGLLPEQTYWLYSREDSASPTCMLPAQVRMPAESPLPYCLGDTTFLRLQLPEMNIDSVKRLHLYATLRGSGTLVAGVMESDGGWDRFTPVDSQSVAPGTQRRLHLTLDSYGGNGRFVALRTRGAAVSLATLAVTDNVWVTAEQNDDNSVTLRGHGKALYGPADGDPATFAVVTVDGSLTLDTLEDTTRYSFYPLDGDSLLPCVTAEQWQTSTAVPLPYCVDFGAGLPLGWGHYGDALDSLAVQVDGGLLTLHVMAGDNSLKLPLMPTGTLVADMEVLIGSGATLTFCGDTVRAPHGSWQQVRLQTLNGGRPAFAVSGEGSVMLRTLQLNACALPRTLTVGLPGGGTTVLDWDTLEAPDPFYFDYHLAHSSETVTIASGRPPLTLQLMSDTTYLLQAKCDSLGGSCQEMVTFTTLAEPQALPYCTSFSTSLPEAWHALPLAGGERLLMMPQFNIDSLRRLNVMLTARLDGGSEVTLGVMSDAGDVTTFDSLEAFTFEDNTTATFFHSLRNYYGHGLFLALRYRGTLEVSHLSVSDCAAFDFRMEEEETDHVVIGWEQQGSPTVSVEYGPLGFVPGTGTVVTSGNPPLRIDGLEPMTNHTFLVSSSCANTPCRPVIRDTFMTFAPQGGEGCIDYTDLHAPYVSCRYGTYSNPSENLGVVDFGYLSAASRHTVHFDTTERDGRTGGLLRTVPEGKQASVRLGNWITGHNGQPQAENITYGMTVDTTMFNLLVLRYAAVLQDPEHSADLQPRFRLQILNAAGEVIDSCGMADFIASPALVGSSSSDWKLAANEVLWKDWTTVGIDLTSYSGQTIYIRLTTNDCGEGSHFGYAYFTLECATKRMQTEGCSNVPTNRFTVPSGFNYRWYTNHDTTTLSDQPSIWVPSDNTTTYYCQLSFIDKPTCNFTMSAFAGARYPLAIIDTLVTVANCEFDLTVTDRSTISGDGVTPIGTGERCESHRWLLPDSSSSTEASVTLHLTDTADVDVTLIAGIANDQCIDTLRRTIHVRRLHPDATLEARGRRCDNERPDTLRIHHAASYTWSDGIGGTRLISPMADTTVTCYTVDTNGCRDTLRHTLKVFPTHNLSYADSVCNTDTAYRWIDTTIAITQTDGVMNRSRHLQTLEGCDSNIALILRLMPTYYIHHHDTLCHDSQLPFFDTLLTTTGDYLHAGNTAFGCDSLVTMHLEIVPRVYADDVREECDSLRWINGRTYTRSISGVKDTLLTPRGCDSVVTLQLTLHYSTLEVERDTFCEGKIYPWRNHLFTEGGLHADTLRTLHQCDSVIAIFLTRLDLPHISISSDYDCQTLDHTLTAHSDVPYLKWHSIPRNMALVEQPSDSVIVVHPTTPTQYILYADYSVRPRCPRTDTITIGPVTLPVARMRVTPMALMATDNTFNAYDIGDEYEERAWYVDGVLQSLTSRNLIVTMPDDKDTTCVMLWVSDGHCADSTSFCVPRLYNQIAVPNAFTPDADDDNNVFRISGKGLLRGELQVFNRNGVLVFRTTNLEEGWDGHDIHGNRCPMGNYVWHLRYVSTVRPDSHHDTTGMVLLIR